VGGCLSSTRIQDLSSGLSQIKTQSPRSAKAKKGHSEKPALKKRGHRSRRRGKECSSSGNGGVILLVYWGLESCSEELLNPKSRKTHLKNDSWRKPKLPNSAMGLLRLEKEFLEAKAAHKKLHAASKEKKREERKYEEVSGEGQGNVSLHKRKGGKKVVLGGKITAQRTSPQQVYHTSEKKQQAFLKVESRIRLKLRFIQKVGKSFQAQAVRAFGASEALPVFSGKARGEGKPLIGTLGTGVR